MPGIGSGDRSGAVRWALAASWGALALALAGSVHAQTSASADAPKGEWKGSAWAHDDASRKALIEQGQLALPAAGGASAWMGKWSERPAAYAPARPLAVVLLMSGSSGNTLKAVGEYQQWLAANGIASFAPDSFALANRVTYKSPIDKASYERIHALRASEIAPALAALRGQPWVNAKAIVLAGSSEGAVPVARHVGPEFAGRILYAWSCETNYFVEQPGNGFTAAEPVLNVISAQDPYFSKTNGWLGNADAKGHCGAAMKGHAASGVVLLPDAPHTVLGLPAARDATAGFLARVLPR